MSFPRNLAARGFCVSVLHSVRVILASQVSSPLPGLIGSATCEIFSHLLSFCCWQSQRFAFPPGLNNPRLSNPRLSNPPLSNPHLNNLRLQNPLPASPRLLWTLLRNPFPYSSPTSSSPFPQPPRQQPNRPPRLPLPPRATRPQPADRCKPLQSSRLSPLLVSPQASAMKPILPTSRPAA